MFPLGTVLFPHGLLPLHVFEPRYRLMVQQCLDGDGTFGVVLIERGSEVGGGDARFDVGTLARIVQARRSDDGRYALVAVGVQRLRVHAWLPEDPYPRADIELLDDTVAGDAAERLDEAARLVQRVRALHSELGTGVQAVAVDLTPGDPARASFEVAALAPVGPLDAQTLLETDDAGVRTARLAELLTDEANVLELRLSGG